MGFEVKYHYYNKKNDSFEYETSDSQEYKKTYGKFDEDYSYEKLVAQINSQYARRDIFVFDVEIYEFQRKKISFKQIKDGFVVKNRKYNIKTFEVTDFVETSESTPVEELSHMPSRNPVVEPQSLLAPMPAVNLVQVQPQPPTNKTRRVIKNVLFSPVSMAERAKFPYKFTLNKKYPVFSERPTKNGIGQMIETIDDLNQPVQVPDEHFVSDDINLIGDSEANFSQKNQGLVDDTLNWSGLVKDNTVPKLR